MQTAVEYFDEQIQERVIAQDVVARKMIIDISMEDYMDIKRQANKMFEQQIIDAHLIGLITSLETEATKQATEYYNETYGSKGSDAQRIYGEHTIIMLEISDEEIAKQAQIYAAKGSEIDMPYGNGLFYGFNAGIQWYREQLKSRQ